MCEFLSLILRCMTSIFSSFVSSTIHRYHINSFESYTKFTATFSPGFLAFQFWTEVLLKCPFQNQYIHTAVALVGIHITKSFQALINQIQTIQHYLLPFLSLMMNSYQLKLMTCVQHQIKCSILYH